MGRNLKSLSLLLSVLLFYHDMCTFAAIAAAHKRTLRSNLYDPAIFRDDTDIDNNYKLMMSRNVQLPALLTDSQLITALQNEGYDQSYELCADWEEFDGTSCVCSNHCEEPNHNDGTINNGFVCDTNNEKHLHTCDFLYKQCSGQIPIKTSLTSCGVCDILKLTGSEAYPEDHIQGLGIFRRDTSGNSWTAHDDHGNVLKLFYSGEAKSWVIGSEDMKHAGIVFVKYTPNPQDSDEGAIVYVNSTYGKQDAFLHLECVTESTLSALSKRENDRPKRFFFLIAMAVISIVATVTSVTVTAIQSQKGCLFFSDVCDLKKETKQLKPEVEGLKKQYENVIGDSDGFRDMVHLCFHQLMNLKDKMVELNQLEKEFNDLSGKIGGDLKYLSPVIAQDFNTSFHDAWMKALDTQTAIGLIGLIYIQIPLEMASLLGATVTTASMAFAAFGAVLSVAAAIITIVASYNSEKKQREELLKIKRNLYEAKQKLTNALYHAEGFQRNFYESVIYPLKKFTQHMSDYDDEFKNLYHFLVSEFGSTMSKTVGKGTYGKVKSTTIKTLTKEKLPSLLSFLSYKITELKQKMEDFKKNKQVIDLIKTNVNENNYPEDILQLVTAVHKTYATNLLPNEYKLLKFIAEKVLTDRSCYWGYKLDGIKSGSLTSSNYKSVALCLSSEPGFITIKDLFQHYTSQNLPPDQIALRIQHNRFSNRYQKIKFLADFVLPSKSCYWGYGLSLIRENKISESDLNNANPSKSSFMIMKTIPETSLTESMCAVVRICSFEWQNYVKCLLRTYDGGNMCQGAMEC